MRERGAVLRGLVGGVAAIALSLFASGCTYPAAVVLAILLPDDGHSDPVVVANGESGPGPVTNPTVVTGPTRSIESPLTLTLTVADGTTRVVAEVVLPDGSVRPITLSRTGEGTIAGNQIVGIQAAGAARTFTVDWAWRSDFPSVPSIASLQFRVTPDGPTGLGLSTDFGPIALGDTIPSIEFVGPKAGSIVSEQVSLVFRIVDAEFDRARIRVRFERADMPGAPPQDIVLVETGDVLSNLLTAPLSQPGVGGRIFSVRWDTERQIPAGQVVDVTLSVEVFETLDLPSGTVELAGAPAAPLSFTVDNAVDVISTDGPRVDLVDFSSVADSHNEIGFDFIVTDPAGAPVDVVFQWRRLGEPFPALPSPLTPAALAAILADPQQRRDLHVMTEAPLVVRGRVPAGPEIDDNDETFRAPALFRVARAEDLVGQTVDLLLAPSDTDPIASSEIASATAAGSLITVFPDFGSALQANTPFRVALRFGPTYRGSATGVRHRFVWGSAVDIGPAPGDQVFVRATPVGAAGAGTANESLAAKEVATDRLDFRGLVPPTGALTAPRAVSIANVDGDVDGLLDLAVLARNPSASEMIVEVFRQMPDGRLVSLFPNPATNPLKVAGTTAANLATGDLGGDTSAGSQNLIDVVVTNSTDTVTLFRRTSAGGYSPLTFAAPSPTVIALGDFDGNGRNDIAVGSSMMSVTSVTVLLQSSDGTTFTPAPIPLASGAQPQRLASGNVDGDAQIDLLVASADGVRLFEFVPGTGQFVVTATYGSFSTPSTTSVSIADVTGDGQADVLAVANNGNLFVFSDSMPPLEVPLPGGGQQVTTGDLNGDRVADVLVSTSRGLVAAYVVPAAPAGLAARTSFLPLPRKTTIPLTTFGAVAVGDIDGDGSAECACVVLNPPGSASNTGVATIAAVDALGRFSISDVLATGIFPVSAALGDFTSDGRPDLAIANSPSLQATLLAQDPSGRLVPHPQDPTASPVSAFLRPSQSAVAIGDFNFDGRADIALASTTVPTSFFLQNSSGLFVESTGIPAATQLVVADFDGDGRDDVAAATSPDANGLPQAITVFYQGDGFMPTPLAPGFPIQDVSGLAAGDFNGDGRLDLGAVVDNSGPLLLVFLGSESGLSTTSLSPAVPAGTGRLATGDVNGDGLAELVVANGNSQAFVVLEGTEAGTIVTPLVSFGISASDAAIDDLNGDGRDDVVLAGGAQISVLLQGSDGVFRRSDITPGASISLVEIGDVNGDGRADLVAVSGSDLSLTVLDGR